MNAITRAFTVLLLSAATSVTLGETFGLETLDLQTAAPRFKTAHTRASSASALVKLSDVEITVQGRDTGAVSRFDARQVLAQLFKQADKDERGYLEMSDLSLPQFQFLRTLFPVVDRNGDGKVTLAELKVGEPIVISSAVGAATDHIMAITMLAGVEPILRSPGKPEMSLGGWNLGGGGDMGGGN